MFEGLSLLRSQVIGKLIPFGSRNEVYINSSEGEDELSDDDEPFECEDEVFLSSVGAEIVTIPSSDDEDTLQFFL